MLRSNLVKAFVPSASLALFAVAAHAFDAPGPHWALVPVPYYINPANSDGLTVAALEAALQVGADSWGDQSNANFAFQYAGHTSGSALLYNGKNEVFFRDESSGSTIAAAYYWYDGSNHLVDADIIFYDAGFTFFTGTSGCSGGIYVEDVAAHEFGHALGLGHSAFADATMYPSISTCSQSGRTIAPDDIEGVEFLYPPQGAPPPLPASPSSLQASPSGVDPTSRIQLSWIDNASNEDGFTIERSADGTSFSVLKQLGVNATSYEDTGLLPGTTLSYRVRAQNSGGSSAFSNVASATTEVVTLPPAAPASPSPTNGALKVAFDADLLWAAAARAQGYDVYFGTQAEPPLYASDVGGTTQILPRLAGSTQFFWRIVAKNGVGSTSSATWSFTTRTKRGGK